jgi:hypothetical protein
MLARIFGPHWRTTLAGIVVFFGALAEIGREVATQGHVDLHQVLATIVALATSVGLFKAADGDART